MPEFLDLYLQDLLSKKEWLKEAYSQIGGPLVMEYIKDVFHTFWINKDLPSASPDEYNILAVDSSFQYYPTSNGGIFYVVRALAISGDDAYRKVYTGFDYSYDEGYSAIFSRMMEWLEHEVVLEAVNKGFKGYILIDGSIYGRLIHVPLEINSAYNKGFMIKYFETLTRLIEETRKRRVYLIGISKESRSRFFREFIVRNALLHIADKLGIDVAEVKNLLALALDEKRKAIEVAEKFPQPIKELIKEYISHKPDFQLIMNCAEKPGYTAPLLLGPPSRTKRAFKLINSDPEKYIKSAYPLLSLDRKFTERAKRVITKLPHLPGVISFYVLPLTIDTPIRVDIPTWVFGIERKLSEIDLTERAYVDVNEILKIISAGYCGLENYNIWLTNVDRRVKLKRTVFENVYLPKFEEIIGRTATSRGYRRVRFP